MGATMTETKNKKIKLNFTEAGQKEYDAYPPPWKHAINRVIEWKEDGHEIIVDVINKAADPEGEHRDRDDAYGYLNDFFAHYMYKIENEWRQQQLISMMSDIRERQKERKLAKQTTKK